MSRETLTEEQRDRMAVGDILHRKALRIIDAHAAERAALVKERDDWKTAYSDRDRLLREVVTDRAALEAVIERVRALVESGREHNRTEAYIYGPALFSVETLEATLAGAGTVDPVPVVALSLHEERLDAANAVIERLRAAVDAPLSASGVILAIREALAGAGAPLGSHAADLQCLRATQAELAAANAVIERVRALKPQFWAVECVNSRLLDEALAGAGAPEAEPKAEPKAAPWPYHAQLEHDLAAANARVAELERVEEQLRDECRELCNGGHAALNAANARAEAAELQAAQFKDDYEDCKQACLQVCDARDAAESERDAWKAKCEAAERACEAAIAGNACATAESRKQRQRAEDVAQLGKEHVKQLRELLENSEKNLAFAKEEHGRERVELLRQCGLLRRERERAESEAAALRAELQAEKDRRVEHRQMNQALNEQAAALRAEVEHLTAHREQLAIEAGQLRPEYGKRLAAESRLAAATELLKRSIR
jgi:hypothetical protein